MKLPAVVALCWPMSLNLENTDPNLALRMTPVELTVAAADDYCYSLNTGCIAFEGIQSVVVVAVVDRMTSSVETQSVETASNYYHHLVQSTFVAEVVPECSTAGAPVHCIAVQVVPSTFDQLLQSNPDTFVQSFALQS